MTAAMSIPGHFDPVPVPRPEAAVDGARRNLIGLSKAEIRAALAEAGLDERQAKLRAKQLWHQIYNRGATDFAAMSDIAIQAAMRTGIDLVVETRSLRGLLVRDRYRLRGAATAMDAAALACAPRR